LLLYFNLSRVCHVVLFFLYAGCYLLCFLSFPTRRSSDLAARAANRGASRAAAATRSLAATGSRAVAGSRPATSSLPATASLIVRSEEHTSELQSREKLVCRLLLEKKKYVFFKTVDVCNQS